MALIDTTNGLDSHVGEVLCTRFEELMDRIAVARGEKYKAGTEYVTIPNHKGNLLVYLEKAARAEMVTLADMIDAIGCLHDVDASVVTKFASKGKGIDFRPALKKVRFSRKRLSRKSAAETQGGEQRSLLEELIFNKLADHEPRTGAMLVEHLKHLKNPKTGNPFTLSGVRKARRKLLRHREIRKAKKRPGYCR